MKLSNRLLIVVASMSVLLPNTARSDDACTPVVQACDKALADQDKVIQLGRKVETTQQSLIDAQDKNITALQNEGSSIFKNPVFYMFVGAVVGGFLVSKAR